MNTSSDLAMKTGVKSILLHPQYDRQEKLEKTFAADNDIALLKLSKELDFNERVQPIALPNEKLTDLQLQLVKLLNGCRVLSTGFKTGSWDWCGRFE